MGIPTNIYDNVTKLLLFQPQMPQIIEFLKAEKSLGVLVFRISSLYSYEEINGWKAYDEILQNTVDEISKTIKANLIINQSPGYLYSSRNMWDEFIYFFSISNERFEYPNEVNVSISREFEIEARKIFNKIVAGNIQNQINFLFGRSTIDLKTIVRLERLIYSGIEDAKLFFYLQMKSQLNIQKKELVNIIQNKNVFIHFQPIIDLKSRKIFGYEALARFKGITEPISIEDIFLLASKFQLSVELERLCRETAIKSASEQFRDGLKLFLNIDPEEILSKSIALKSFTNLIKDHGFTPEVIVLEITERSQIHNIRKFNRKMHHFKRMGFSIAIDDVGAGYSSLNAIAILNPQLIKIDIQLVRNIHNDHLKQSIVQSILSFAKDNDIMTLAEGIESQGEYQKMLELGVDLGQGYLFGKPSLYETYRELQVL